MKNSSVRVRMSPDIGLPTHSLTRWMLLAVGVLLAVSAYLIQPAEALAQEATEPAIYTVVAGDTLYEIAVRFDLTLEDLVAANNIVDVNLIDPDQVLVIPDGSLVPALPAANTALVHALPGESLTSLALRTQQDPAIVASLNQFPDSARLFPGQPVRVLKPYVPQQPRSYGAILDTFITDELIQGRTGHIVVTTRKPLELRADWNGLPLVFTTSAETPLRQFAFLPVPGLLATGAYSLTVAYTSTDNVTLSRTWRLNVIDGGYDRTEINLPPDRSVLLEPETIQTEIERLVEIWSQNSPELLWTEVFSRPIGAEHPTSNPFGTRRSYNGGPYSSYHAGQDFGAPVGITVTAPADGIVALSEPLNVRGNAVLLDHGRGVFTGYWHLDEFFVQAGQPVAAGDPIGLVGNTGLSTGAHLHWELRIYGIAVDPMQFIEETLHP